MKTQKVAKIKFYKSMHGIALEGAGILVIATAFAAVGSKWSAAESC